MMIYVPWNSVLLIQGPIPEDLDRERKKLPRPRSPSGTYGSVANAQTATEVAVARGAADAWLAANPSDGDVRMALDRLPDPTGD
jgi:hypothetical protein